MAKNAENEVERLLKVILPGTEFAHKTHAVGGFCRDQYLGLEAKDLDIVVEMKDGGEKITKFLYDMFPNKISHPRQMGASYPIWQIHFKGNITYQGEKYETYDAVIEFSDTMKETFPDGGSRQRETGFGDLQDDVERRDFTCNMLMKDLTNGEFIDMTGVSKNDIEKGILRGHPNVSLDKIFSDDPLRMIRLVRFYCKYGWFVPRDVLYTVKRNAERIKIVSAERVMGELTKVMQMGKLNKAIKFMKLTGLLQYVLPEIQELKGVEQSPNHHAEGDVYNHTLKVLENAPASIEGQLAALLHDIGKPQSQEILEDNIRFLGHEDVGGEIAEAILRRLKFDTDTIKKVKLMVENHMRPHVLNDASDKALRKFIREVGDEMVDSILDLAEADANGSLPVVNDIPELRERLKNIQNSPVPVSKKAILNGLEIMDILGVKPGAIVGEATKFLLDIGDDYAERGEEFTKEKAKEELLKRFK